MANRRSLHGRRAVVARHVVVVDDRQCAQLLGVQPKGAVAVQGELTVAPLWTAAAKDGTPHVYRSGHNDCDQARLWADIRPILGRALK